MNIKVGEHVFVVQIHEQSGFISKHTGVVLKRLKVEFRVRVKSENEEVVGLIERAKQEGLRISLKSHSKTEHGAH